jgi:hypothetical protein
VRNTRNNSSQERSVTTSVLFMVERAETQTVHGCKRPCTHGEDVPQNSSNAGGSALEGFNEGWMIMRFNFERDAPPVAHIDYASILAWRHNYAFSAGWQSS